MRVTGKRTPRQIERDLVRYREDLQQAEATRDLPKQATALNNLGTVFIDKKNYPKALRHFEQAMDVLAASPPKDKVSVYGNAASAARGLDDWDKSLRYALMAETIGIQNEVHRADIEAVRVGIALVRKELGFDAFKERLSGAQEALPEELRPLARMDIHLIPEEEATSSDPQLSSSCARIGRNAPCPCGSGKKYKKCCEK